MIDGHEGQSVHVCVLHQRRATYPSLSRATAENYPVGRFYIVSSTVCDSGWQTALDDGQTLRFLVTRNQDGSFRLGIYRDDGEPVKNGVSRMESGALLYNVPMLDAHESWVLIASSSKIHPLEYLSGYRLDSDGTLVNVEDEVSRARCLSLKENLRYLVDALRRAGAERDAKSDCALPVGSFYFLLDAWNDAELAGRFREMMGSRVSCSMNAGGCIVEFLSERGAVRVTNVPHLLARKEVLEITYEGLRALLDRKDPPFDSIRCFLNDANS